MHQVCLYNDDLMIIDDEIKHSEEEGTSMILASTQSNPFRKREHPRPPQNDCLLKAGGHTHQVHRNNDERRCHRIAMATWLSALR